MMLGGFVCNRMFWINIKSYKKLSLKVLINDLMDLQVDITDEIGAYAGREIHP